MAGLLAGSRLTLSGIRGLPTGLAGAKEWVVLRTLSMRSTGNGVENSAR